MSVPASIGDVTGISAAVAKPCTAVPVRRSVMEACASVHYRGVELARMLSVILHSVWRSGQPFRRSQSHSPLRYQIIRPRVGCTCRPGEVRATARLG